jgi:hypothetical protein
MGHILQVILYRTPDSVELSRRESVVCGEGERPEPELAGCVVTLHVDMHGLHAIEAVEEETIGTGDPSE